MKTILLIFFTIVELVAYSQVPIPLPGFGTDGKVVTDFPGDDANSFKMAIQDDHKIVVVGRAFSAGQYDIAVSRYNTDGTLDNSFDADGRLVINLGPTSYESANDVVIQPDGKIVMCGTVYHNPGGPTGPDILLVRINPDGTFDNSFDADGVVVTDIGSAAQSGRCLLLQPDGKIVVGGDSRTGALSTADFLVLRYNTDGSLDENFNGTGYRLTDFNGLEEFGYEITIKADGMILLAGYSKNSTENEFAIARYTTGGLPDIQFDGDGKLTTDMGTVDDRAWAITVQPDQKILVAGQAGFGPANEGYALARYNADGSLDNTFNGNGKVITPEAAGFGGEIDALAIQPDGKILTASTRGDAGNITDDFAILRYNSNGTLDNTFDTDGMYYIDFGAQEFVYDIKLDGNIIYACGSTNLHVPPFNSQFALAALVNDLQTTPLISTSFTAKKENEKVKLQWQTSSEENTTTFMVERHEGDGRFKAIGQVQAAGNSYTLKDYSFNDAKPVRGINYYRLKLYNTNGKYNYSKTLAVEMNKAGVAVFPNPVDDLLYIQTQDMNRSAIIFLVDATGKILRSQSITADAAGIFKLSVKELSAGNYFIQVVIDGNKKTIPFIKR